MRVGKGICGLMWYRELYSVFAYDYAEEEDYEGEGTREEE